VIFNVKITSKLNNNLNIKAETVVSYNKILHDLHDLKVHNDFLDITPKAQTAKE
jgi:hypothetical protein